MSRLRSFAHTIKGWWKHDPRSVPGRLVRGAWNVMLFPLRPKATTAVAGLRRNDCHLCSIYDDVHDTCGDMVDGETYVHPITGKTLPLGCGCDIEMKSKIADADCWRYVKGLEGGWRREINGSEH